MKRPISGPRPISRNPQMNRPRRHPFPTQPSGHSSNTGVVVGVAIAVGVVAAIAAAISLTSTGSVAPILNSETPSARAPKANSTVDRTKPGETTPSLPSSQTKVSAPNSLEPVIWYVNATETKLVAIDLNDPESGIDEAIAETLIPYARAGMKEDVLREMAEKQRPQWTRAVDDLKRVEKLIQDHGKKSPDDLELIPAVRSSANDFILKTGGSLAASIITEKLVANFFATARREADARKIASGG